MQFDPHVAHAKKDSCCRKQDHMGIDWFAGKAQIEIHHLSRFDQGNLEFA